MTVLSIRTDTPEAEISLIEDGAALEKFTWLAGRQLSVTIHQNIVELLKRHNKTWQDLGGIICFLGPGSFTGLRIGLTVGNALAFGLEVPIVGARNDEWIKEGLKKLQNGVNEKVITPFYGADPHITKPRK